MGMIIQIYKQTIWNNKSLWCADLYEGNKLKLKCFMSGYSSKKELLQNIPNKNSFQIYQKSKSFFA